MISCVRWDSFEAPTLLSIPDQTVRGNARLIPHSSPSLWMGSLFVALLVVGCTAGPAAAQQSIGDVLYDVIIESGVEEAITRYHELKAQRADAYDFSESELNRLGYELLEEGRTDEAIAVLELNAQAFPSSLNVYDSLAEAHLRAGRRDRAVGLYREVLRRVPDADLPPNFKNFYRNNAEENIFVVEHFDAPSPDALHYVSFYGGPPAGRWDRENAARFKDAEAGRTMSYQGFNLYAAPVPTAVGRTLDEEPRADVSVGFVGGVYRQRIDAGAIADISDLWTEHGWDDAFAMPVRAMASVGERRYFVPMAFQWNPIFYRKDLFDSLQVLPPETWDDLLALCDTISDHGRTPFTISVRNWPPPVARWFSILNLRLNGADFHRSVVRGEVPFTDDRIRSVFVRWQELFDRGCFADDSAENNYAQGVADIQEGRALMYNIGEWLYESLPAGYDRLDFFPMPVLDSDVPTAEIVHLYGAFMRADTNHPRDARDLLTYLGGETSQQSNAETLGRLTARTRAGQAGYSDLQRRMVEHLSSQVAAGVPLLEFSMRPEMAQAALEAFAGFWARPHDIDGTLEALEAARRAYH